MKTLQITVNDNLAVLKLDRGRSNPINIEMIAELTSAIKDIEADDNIGGVIITGKEGFFSAGVDLIEVYDYNEDQVKEFWTTFLMLQSVLFAFKKPFVAAISGHSPAGGCLLALCCDYRVMARGPYGIGLNEVPVGIVVPEAVFHLYAFWLGRRKAYQYLMEGKLLMPEEALKDGLVDEVCEAEDVLAAAEKKARQYMKFGPATWGQTKLNLRKEICDRLQADNGETLAKMLEQWWAPETRSNLQKIISKLTNPVKTK
jgi:enoyl-CoA hydratase/carnithine racemase